MIRQCLLAVVGIAAFALAPLQASAADAVITEFTVKNLSEILTEMGGAEVTPRTDDDGIVTVEAKFSGEPTEFTMIACAQGQVCRDLQMWIIFDRDDRFTPAFANGFNGDWLDATAYAREDKTLMLRNLIIANGGLTREHLKEVFKMFLNAPGLLGDYMKKQGNIVMKPTDTKPVSYETKPVHAPYVNNAVTKRRLPR